MAIIVMKIHCIVRKEPVHKIALDVPIIGVFQLLGTAMGMTTVWMEVTNHLGTVSLREEPVLGTCLLVTMAIVYRGSIFVMGTMIVWIIRMKMNDISVVSRKLYAFYSKSV